MSATSYSYDRFKKTSAWSWPFLRVSGLTIVCLILVSCVPPVPPPIIESEPVSDPKPASPIEKPSAVSHAIENDAPIIAVDQPWELVERAKTATNRDAPALLIRAINAFLDRAQHADARLAMATLMAYSLTFDEKFSLHIMQARLAAVDAKYEHAIELLTALDYNQIRDVEIKKQALHVLAGCQVALGRLPASMATRLNLDRLVSHAEQLENQQQIVQLLQMMNALQHALLRETLFDPAISGWLALANILNSTDPTQINIDLENWQRIYPNHPAQSQLIERYIAALDEYQQIALLLPLTSTYGTAARAFYDGFIWAHKDNTSSKPPKIMLYDVGEEPYLSSFYYQIAVNQGADFVVGPLGRKASHALLATQPVEVATLLISEVPTQNIADSLFGISLSPEPEARQTASQAFMDGHRQATVFRIHSEWGDRVANAFIAQWQSLGGVIVKNKSFPSEISDYTRIIQKLLGLDESLARKRLLEAQIDVNLKFTARRNDDLDMLFLAANAEQSRLVVPQLRFFQAHNLPIYATSYVYSGNPNPVVDADLDGLIFGDMRWILQEVARYKSEIAAQQAHKEALKDALKDTPETTEENGDNNIPGISSANVAPKPTQIEATTPETRPETRSQPLTLAVQNPYKNSTLNRLYALGIQSYQTIPRLTLLRDKTMTQFFGEAMTVSVDQDGNVMRLPVWAKFVSGLAEPLLNHRQN